MACRCRQAAVLLLQTHSNIASHASKRARAGQRSSSSWHQSRAAHFTTTTNASSIASSSSAAAPASSASSSASSTASNAPHSHHPQSSSSSSSNSNTTAEQTAKDGNPNRYAFTLDGVSKRLQSGRLLFKDIRLSFFDGAKIGIVGSNGSGKSSLLKIIAGVDKEYDGVAQALPGYKIGYLAQEPVLDNELSVYENVMLGLRPQRELLERYDACSQRMAEELSEEQLQRVLEQQAALQEQIDEQNLWDLQYLVQRAMQALGCPPNDADVKHLSGGEKRRVALCQLLLSKPHLLLLDEPTNHMDADAVLWLEQYLASYKGLVIAITHDRYFLDNVAGYILEIDSGQLYPHKGNYQAYLHHRSQRLELEKKRETSLNKMMRRELEWLRGGRRTGQQSKGKARAQAFDALQQEKLERKRNKRIQGGSMCIPEGPALRDFTIVQVHELTYWHDDLDASQPLMTRLSFTVQRDDVLGIIGPNGTGKTTLLKLLVGELQAKSGRVVVSPHVRYGYASQQRTLDPNAPVWQEVVGVKEQVQIDAEYSMPARAYVAQFNFSGPDQSKLCSQLSGGERNRASIAKALSGGANVIVLDEPTNDLDTDTLRSLEDALQDWSGAAIIVSHDRWFLDRVCNKILALESDGSARLYEGGYQEYIHR